MTPRFVVLGAGAVGGAIGGRLAEGGAEVVLIARGAHGAALRDHGLRLESPDRLVTLSLDVVASPDAIAWRDDDVVLLAVKSQDAAAALAELALAAPPPTPVVCLSNGLEVERLASRWFAAVHGACVFLPATLAAPGVVQEWFAPLRGSLVIGRYPHGTDAIDDALVSWLARTGHTARVDADVMRWKRGKLLSNLGNAIEALCGPGAHGAGALRDRAIAEARAVFAASGLSVPTAGEEAAMREGLVRGTIAGADRAGGSTWQSLARGAGSAEGDYLNGEIALLGRTAGIATPVNAFLQRKLAAAARAGTRPGSITVAALVAELDRDG